MDPEWPSDKNKLKLKVAVVSKYACIVQNCSRLSIHHLYEIKAS